MSRNLNAASTTIITDRAELEKIYPKTVVRFFILHPDKGIYLGNGWWSNSPEGKNVNSIPTFTQMELAAIMGAGAASGVDNSDEKVMFEIVHNNKQLIDMAGERISELNALHFGIVTQRWTQ